MASTFNGVGLFNSGPHRFNLWPEGELTIPNSRLNPLQPGSFAVGPLELVIEVHGRLVASNDSTLWTLRDAIGAALGHPPTTGTLVDHHGRSWLTMSFIRFEPLDRTDRGRVHSLGYRATFVRFL